MVINDLLNGMILQVETPGGVLLFSSKNIHAVPRLQGSDAQRILDDKAELLEVPWSTKGICLGIS